METARFVVEVRYPKALLFWLLFGKATRKKVAGGGEAGKLERGFDTLTTHSDRLSEVGDANDDKRVGFDANSEQMSAEAQRGA